MLQYVSDPVVSSVLLTAGVYLVAMLIGMSHVPKLRGCKHSPSLSYGQFITWPLQLHKLPFSYHPQFLTSMYLAVLGLLLGIFMVGCSLLAPGLVGGPNA